MNKDHEDFIQRAGFQYRWVNLESWARRMAKQAVEEINELKMKLAEAEKQKKDDTDYRLHRHSECGGGQPE